jgi:hypothetical protein
VVIHVVIAAQFGSNEGVTVGENWEMVAGSKRLLDDGMSVARPARGSKKLETIGMRPAVPCGLEVEVGRIFPL